MQVEEIRKHIPVGIVVDWENDKLVERIGASLSHPLAESFTNCMKRLAEWTWDDEGFRKPGHSVKLFMDFAPLSFMFAEEHPKVRGMQGGVIFHGSHDRGGDGGGPTFSVNITPASGWRIHT